MGVSKPPIGALVVLVVLVICLLLINTAVKQRDERRQWVLDTSNRILGLNNQLSQTQTKLTEATSELETKTNSLSNTIDLINLSISNKTFINNPIAGCYGIIPKDNVTQFSLSCDTEFNWN